MVENMSTTASAASGQDTSLRLRGVLDTALPHELGTDHAPDTYTVTAVFSRRVSGPEQALIEQPTVVEALADRGYPGIRLKVEDRRLLISNTNLAMLGRGLAGEIATVLRDVEAQLTAKRTRQAEELKELHAAEARRAATIKTAADLIRFE